MTNKGKDAQAGDTILNLGGKPVQHPIVSQGRYGELSGRKRKLWIGGLSLVLCCLVAIVVAVAIVKATQNKHAIKQVTKNYIDANGSPVGLQGNTISSGYVGPRNKQGIHDQRFYDDVNMRPIDLPRLASLRYEAYQQDIEPGVRRYNVFWQPFESSQTLPSSSPMACPNGYQLVPSSAAELQAKGYNRFHCYASAQIKLFEAYLALDAQHGIQSCATIWSVPDPPFRHPDCGGQQIHNQTIFCGCVPKDNDALMDFQDFVNFLAEHYNSDAQGRFTHYIIWNEVANGDWFDASPMLDNLHGVSDKDTEFWLDMYALMLQMAHDAIARHRTVPTMLYVSIDQIWERPGGPCPPCFGNLQHCHLGSKNVVLGIWQRLGVSMDWSLAIHPYGHPLKNGWPYDFYFKDVVSIAAFQMDQLRKYGVSEPDRWPQAMLAATEQGWQAMTPEQQLSAAENICIAHDIMTSSPYALFATHNDFQAIQYNDTTGLVPRWTGRTLNDSNRMDSPTFAAYVSSHPLLWNSDASHFCCSMHQRGCPTATGQTATILHNWG